MEMLKLRTHWLLGKFFILGIPNGWTIYPVTYKGKQYVVDLFFKMYSVESVNDWTFRIYEYGKEKRFFQKHRRRKIYEINTDFIKIDEGKYRKLSDLSNDDFKIYMPKIIKELFDTYEQNMLQEKERKRKISDSEHWDGVVDKLN